VVVVVVIDGAVHDHVGPTPTFTTMSHVKVYVPASAWIRTGTQWFDEKSLTARRPWSYQLVLPAMATDADAPSVAKTEVEAEPETTAIDAVFERLLADIVKGVHPAGTRLPAERELARQLGASRPTLREALRQLGEWKLVEPRRGSGIVVRPYRDWSIEVIAAYLRHGKPDASQPTLAQVLIDMFAMRRAVVTEVIRLTASRIPKGGTKTARLAMARAWSLREQPAYVAEDFEVMRQIALAAKFTPGLWLLNRVADIWLDAASALRLAIRAPDDYVAVHSKFFDLIEDGQGEAARKLMDDYLERHDGRIVDMLKAIA
jgi:DNA-binding FadR family transcriptional regulator